ncbi:hypothetical protein MKX01_023188 [Papaver californicum]|nr:hypothetical protein MKX01_023188 [Papaver californicum]
MRERQTLRDGFSTYSSDVDDDKVDTSVDEPPESISLDLGFSGKSLAKGRRRGFQLHALPMILGALLSARTASLEGLLLRRFLVGTGMGVGPYVFSLYVTEFHLLS